MADDSDEDAFESADEDDNSMDNKSSSNSTALKDSPDESVNVQKVKDSDLNKIEANFAQSSISTEIEKGEFPSNREILSQTNQSSKDEQENVIEDKTFRQGLSKCSESPLDSSEKSQPPNDGWSSSWGGWGSSSTTSWGGWGASLISSATKSVAQFSNEVYEGLNVLVDNSLEEESDIQRKANVEDSESKVSSENSAVEHPEADKSPQGLFSSFGLTNLESSLTEKFSNLKSLTSPSTLPSSIGLGIVEGSLNMLEQVGRKTMDLIKETEGIETTRAIFDDRRGKPNLSELLREGKQIQETEEKKKMEMLENQQNHFNYWIEEYQGMAHLEALEMLSHRCETDVSELLESQDPENAFESNLLVIKNVFTEGDNEEEDEMNSTQDKETLEQMLTFHLEKLEFSVSSYNFIAAREEAINSANLICKFDRKDQILSNKDVHISSIKSLASLVAKSIEIFHKIGQIALLPKVCVKEQSKSSSKTFEEEPSKMVDSFVARLNHLSFIVKLLIGEIDAVASLFGQSLTKVETLSEIEINQLMTDIFLEASQGSSHVRSAFKLLLPVSQLAFLKENLFH